MLLRMRLNQHLQKYMLGWMAEASGANLACEAQGAQLTCMQYGEYYDLICLGSQ